MTTIYEVTLEHLHAEEVGSAIFDPTNYDMDILKLAKRRIRNPVWAEVYNSLKKCRLNILNIFPDELFTIANTSEPDITK